MAVSSDILRSYRRPGAVFESLLDRGMTDRLSLVFLALAMALSFVSQLPSIGRRSREPNPELEALIRAEAGEVRQIEGTQVPQDMIEAKYQLFLAQELMVWFFILPLMFYGLALISLWVLRRFGARLDGVSARAALFWALLVAVPMKLIHGMVYAAVDDGVILMAAGVPWFGIFVWNWIHNLRVAGWAQ